MHSYTAGNNLFKSDQIFFLVKSVSSPPPTLVWHMQGFVNLQEQMSDTLPDSF